MTIVVGVPHSGNRSLLKHLRDAAVEPELSEGPAHIWHFGYHDDEIALYVGVIHIPIRDPADVMRSWIVRGKPLAEMYQSMETMAAYNNPLAVVYRVEDIPTIEGHEEGTAPDRATLRQTFLTTASPRVRQYYARGNY